jgi:alpha-D-xyloside xylohydrolase
VLFSRSATAGCQQFPVHWGGDCKGNFNSMAETLRGGLSLGLSGFAFWSHDIGGFENTSPASVYKRWCAFGLLSSHSRLHGSQSYRVPWSYDKEAVDVLRHFTQWKCRMMPYIYQLAEEAHETGAPVMRAMLLEFPDDPTCAYLDRQYMLGNALLVAPVMREDNRVEYYLPQGCWTHLFTGKKAEGGWHEEEYGFMSLPLYVRENTILALGSNDQRPDYDYLEDMKLYAAHLTDGGTASTRVISQARDKAVDVSVKCTGDEYTVSFQNLAQPCSLILPEGEYVLQSGSAEAQADTGFLPGWSVPAGTEELVFVRK